MKQDFDDAEAAQLAVEMQHRGLVAARARNAALAAALLESAQHNAAQPRPKDHKGYKVLRVGSQVQFFREGAWQRGKVIAVHFDANRKPGIGRVSYSIEFHAAFVPVRVAAMNVLDGIGDAPVALVGRRINNEGGK